MKLLGLLESTQTITLVMENLAGGDVLHHIEKVSLYRESDASALVRQLVSALAHCRAQGVVHRDVKVRASVRPRCLFVVYSADYLGRASPPHTAPLLFRPRSRRICS